MVQIGFSTTNTWVSRVIRFMTGSEISHSVILYYDSFLERKMVLESADIGFRLISWDSFLLDNVLVEVFPISEVYNPQEGVRKAMDWLGTSYSYRTLLGHLLMIISEKVWRKIKNPLTSANAMICSESCILMLQAIGYPGAIALDPQDTTPMQLLDYMRRTADL